jgi:hypothetical protein
MKNRLAVPTFSFRGFPTIMRFAFMSLFFFFASFGNIVRDVRKGTKKVPGSSYLCFRHPPKKRNTKVLTHRDCTEKCFLYGIPFRNHNFRRVYGCFFSADLDYMMRSPAGFVSFRFIPHVWLFFLGYRRMCRLCPGLLHKLLTCHQRSAAVQRRQCREPSRPNHSLSTSPSTNPTQCHRPRATR